MEEGEKADGSLAEALAAPCLSLNHSMPQQKKKEKKKGGRLKKNVVFYYF